MAAREFYPGMSGLNFSWKSGRRVNDVLCSRRDVPMATDRAFSGSIQCVSDPLRGDDHSSQAAGSALPGARTSADELWQEFFSDPSQWWDNREAKGRARYPDFTHRTTDKALWIYSHGTPPWVEESLLELEPGSVPLSTFSWNKKLVKLVKLREYQQVLDHFEQLAEEGILPDRFTFVPVLNACAGLRALQVGKHVHEQVLQQGLEHDDFVGSSLMNMYIKCGSIDDAWQAFGMMSRRDVVTWTTMISGFVKFRQAEKALALYTQMMEEDGVEPNRYTFVAALNACANLGDLEKGKKVHEAVIQGGCEANTFVGSSLVDMYAKCGSLGMASRVFNKMPSRTVVSWNAMILAYSRADQGKKALELFHQMQDEGYELQNVTFVGALNACANLGDVQEGRRIHIQIMRCSSESNTYVGNSLMDMYVKCGCLEDAWGVFRSMSKRNVVAWSILIHGLVKAGRGEEAIGVYREMLDDGVQPDQRTFVAALNACASSESLEEGRVIHRQLVENGFELDSYTGSSLVDMYAKCGAVDEALRVFWDMPRRDVVTWTAIIVGLANSGKQRQALEAAQHMQEDGVKPNKYTILALLKACASSSSLKDGRRLHEVIIQAGWESDLFICSSLVDMYCKCHSMEDAWAIFSKMRKRDSVAWGTLILGCIRCKQFEKGLDLLQQMESEGLIPQPAILVALLHTCAAGGLLEEGRRVHSHVIRSGLESDVVVGNSLIDMYSKSGSIPEAVNVFENLPNRDVITWSSMMLGYVRDGEPREALNLGQRMEAEGVKPNSFTFVALLNACGDLSAINEGRQVHERIIGTGYESDVFVSTSLVDMYAKCDSIQEARRVFDNNPTSDVGAWNAMTMGYLRCKKWPVVLELSRMMQDLGVEMDNITYMAVLYACSSLRELEQGQEFHRQAVEKGYELDSYVVCSLIDLYSKCGRIDKAWSVFKKMATLELVVCNAMIRACVSSGQRQEVSGLVDRMKQDGMLPENAEAPTYGPRMPGLTAVDFYQQSKDGVRKLEAGTNAYEKSGAEIGRVQRQLIS